MKKLLITLLIISTSVFAYTMSGYVESDGGYGGRCDNGATFAGNADYEGWHTVVASSPKGYGNSPSKDKAIRKACGE